MEGINCNKAQKAAITCAEDIAALFLLHQPKQVVADPSQNRDTHSLPEQSEYVLPFEVERRLTGAFAFLSGRTHGPNNVTAVCILEAPEAPPCLKVMVAVNRQNARDGSHVLDCLRAEFENIFALLAQVEGRLHLGAVLIGGKGLLLTRDNIRTKSGDQEQDIHSYSLYAHQPDPVPPWPRSET